MPDIFDGSQQTDQTQTDTQVSTSIENDSAVRGGGVTASNATDSVPQHTHTSATSSSKRNKEHRHVDDYSEVMRQEQSCANPLHSFVPKPSSISFSNQAESETIILLLRQHPFTQVKWVVIAILLGLLPVLFSSIGFLSFLPGTYKFAIALGWYMLVLGYVFESFLKWFFNIYILTDERVIDIDFISLIYKDESSAKIDNIEDVTASMGGVSRSIFNYGTVKIQTAAADVEFEFEDVPQPNKVVKLINELILEEEQEKLDGRAH